MLAADHECVAKAIGIVSRDLLGLLMREPHLLNSRLLTGVSATLHEYQTVVERLPAGGKVSEADAALAAVVTSLRDAVAADHARESGAD